MKIGDKVEGSPQEIHDLFKNQGMNLSEYLEAPESPLANRWLVIPASIYGILILTLSLSREYPRFATSLFFGSLLVGFWSSIAFHLRWKSGYITVFTAVAALLLSAMAAGFIGPTDAIKILKESKGEK